MEPRELPHPRGTVRRRLRRILGRCRRRARPVGVLPHDLRLLPDGAELTCGSTLRFRRSGEIEASLTLAGFDLTDMRAAPDRPGLELVFHRPAASRPIGAPPRRCFVDPFADGRLGGPVPHVSRHTLLSHLAHAARMCSWSRRPRRPRRSTGPPRVTIVSAGGQGQSLIEALVQPCLFVVIDEPVRGAKMRPAFGSTRGGRWSGGRGVGLAAPCC